MRIDSHGSPSGRRLMGLAIGAVWLVAISAIFGLVALVAISTPAARRMLPAATAAVATIIGFGIAVARQVASLPQEPRRKDEQGVAAGFVRVFAAEILAVVVVNTWAVTQSRFILIPSLDLIIVGLHFFPLAALFRVPRYHVMALLFCLIPVATLMLLPEASLIGHAQSWYVVPSLGCGLVAAATAVAGLKEAWDSVRTYIPVGAR